MNQFEAQLNRIRDDVGHAQGKLGPRTTVSLLQLLGEMAVEIDRLTRRVEELRKG